jgi:Fe-S-cluster containining protein
MCGNCCTGPEGFVLVNTPEVDALAARLGLSREDFVARYTKLVPEGLSLRDVPTTHGFDCVFLDRTTVPGKAVCGVYEDRPRQCRTWPFWTSVLRTEAHWRNTKRTCPGIDKGTFYPAEKIRILRAVVDI